MKTDDVLQTETEATLPQSITSATTTIANQVQLVKKAKSADEVVKILHSCLEAPGVYVFGELLILPNVKEVCRSLRKIIKRKYIFAAAGFSLFFL